MPSRQKIDLRRAAISFTAGVLSGALPSPLRIEPIGGHAMHDAAPERGPASHPYKQSMEVRAAVALGLMHEGEIDPRGDFIGASRAQLRQQSVHSTALTESK
jgi:hypothetical protein